MSDIPLREIEPSFIEDFHYYLTVTRSLASGTVIGAITKLKQLILYSIRKRYISYNPFMGVSLHGTIPGSGISDRRGVTNLHARRTAALQATQVRDIFVFCCFTRFVLFGCEETDLRSY
ncbi:MAG: phage integrase SAM-like domain-containing protein [Alistipes finegoldii]